MRSSAPFTPSTLMRFLLSGSPPHGRDELKVLAGHVVDAGDDEKQVSELKGVLTGRERSSFLADTHPEVLHSGVEAVPNCAGAIHALHRCLLVGSVGVVFPHGGAGVWAGAWRAGDDADGVPPVTTPPEPHGSSGLSSSGTTPPLRASTTHSPASTPTGSSGAAAGLSGASGVFSPFTRHLLGWASTTLRGRITQSPTLAVPQRPAADPPLTRCAFTLPGGMRQLQSSVTMMV